MPYVDFTTFLKHTQEVHNLDNLKAIATERQLKGYWGTAPTGRPHVAYLFPILAISRMIKAGCNMTVMFADYHAALDNNKTEWEALHARTDYYMLIIKELLKLTGTDLAKIRFVKGTDFQRGNPAYLDDLLKLSTKVTTKMAQHATADVVKCNKDPLLSNIIYPLMQVLDEEHLETDFELGGLDQRKIFMFGVEHLHKIGYGRARSYVMTPMICSLAKPGQKMSCSDSKSKIDLLDSEEDIVKKCNGAFSTDGVVENNGVLQMFKYIIFEFSSTVKVERPDQYGGDKTYSSYIELEDDFSRNLLSSIDLKVTLGRLLNVILKPLRENILTNHSDIVERAYLV